MTHPSNEGVFNVCQSFRLTVTATVPADNKSGTARERTTAGSEQRMYGSEVLLKRSPLFALVLVLSSAVLFVAGPVFGQARVFEALPMPIGSADVESYCDQIGVDENQRSSIHEAHSQYKDRFASIYKEKYAGLLNSIRTAQPGAYIMEDRQAVSNISKEQRRVMSQIAALDRDFFGDVLAILAPAQAENLHLIQLQRERSSYHGELSRYVTRQSNNPAVAIELRSLLMRVGPSAGEMVSLEPILVNYETKLTTQLRDLHRASIGLFGDVFVALDQLGFSPELKGEGYLNPGRELEAKREAWRIVAEKLMERASRVSMLQWSTFQRVSSLLSLPRRLSLRRHFFAAYYSNFPASGIEGSVYVALTEAELSEHAYRQVIDIGEQLLAERDLWIQRLVNSIEERRAESQMFSFDAASSVALDKAMGEILSRLDEADESARLLLQNLLGDELFDDVSSRGSSLTIPSQIPSAGSRTVDTMRDEFKQLPVELHAQLPYLPEPVEAQAFRDYLHDFGITQQDDARLRYEQYLAAYNSLKTREFMELLRRWQSVIGQLQHTMDEPIAPDADQIVAMCHDEQNLQDIVWSLDGELFEALLDLAPNVGDAPRRILRAAAQRELSVFGHSMFGGPLFGETREWTVDLCALLSDNGIPISAPLTALVDEYYGEALALAGRRRDAWAIWRLADLQMQANDKSAWLIVQARRQGEVDREIVKAVYTAREILGFELADAAKALREVELERSRQNHSYLSRACAVITPNNALNLQSTYNRKSFPAVYPDSWDEQERISLLAQSTEVGPATHLQIDLLLTEHSQRDTRLREASIAIYRDRLSALTAAEGAVSFAAMQDFEKARLARAVALRWLAFERSELGMWLHRESETVLEQTGRESS